MSADYFMDMSEEANLRFSQQRVDIGCKYIKYTIEHKQIEVQKIIYYYRDLSELIQHNSESIFAENIGIIDKVEVMLGVGSWKGRMCMDCINYRKIYR